MKALSIKQPWAWLIVNGYKDIENRTWGTNYRGLFLIHASKQFDKNSIDWISKTFPELAKIINNDLAIHNSSVNQRGGIVGIAELIDCVTRHKSPWYTGDYAFVVSHPKILPFERCRGNLRFFSVNQEII